MTSINNELFRKKLPKLGHNVFGGKIAHDIKKGFRFECGCGATHSCGNAFAIREHREAGSAIYACPNNDRLLNLVEPYGMFRVKGLRTVVSFLSDENDELYARIFTFQDMQEMGLASLQEYYEA